MNQTMEVSQPPASKYSKNVFEMTYVPSLTNSAADSSCTPKPTTAPSSQYGKKSGPKPSKRCAKLWSKEAKCLTERGCYISVYQLLQSDLQISQI